MCHACTTHTLAHTPAHTCTHLSEWELSADCRATPLSSPTDECGLCHGLAATLPIKQRQLRILRATVGRIGFIVYDKVFGSAFLVSRRLSSARLGLAWLWRRRHGHGRGGLLLRVVVAMCDVLRRGLRNAATALQQATAAAKPYFFLVDFSLGFFFCSCCACAALQWQIVASARSDLPTRVCLWKGAGVCVSVACQTCLCVGLNQYSVFSWNFIGFFIVYFRLYFVFFGFSLHTFTRWASTHLAGNAWKRNIEINTQ